MKISYRGIGQMCATFACGDTMAEGKPVKVSADSTAAVCAAGDAFCGVCAAVGRAGDACSVQLRGFVTVPYTGTAAPAVGYSRLAANGTGGIKTGAETDRAYLVVQVDTTAKTATIML